MLKPFFLPILWFISIPAILTAGDYAEHKRIGDEAFVGFMKKVRAIKDTTVDTNERKAAKVFLKILDTTLTKIHRFGKDSLPISICKNTRFFPWFGYYRDNSDHLLPLMEFRGTEGGIMGVTYGDLTAISGDHSIDAMEIFRALQQFDPKLHDSIQTPRKYAKHEQGLVRELELQSYAISRGFTSEDKFTLGIDYLWLAFEDQSHFRRPYQSIKEQLAEYDAEVREQLKDYIDANPDINGQMFNLIFHGKNAVVKYFALHQVALYYAANAGICLKIEDDRTFPSKIRLALLYSAFASHYLQDMFAAGHSLVNRDACLPNGLAGNAIHDYYNQIGLPVKNAKGDRWIAFGDGYFYKNPQAFDIAIQANISSLMSLFECMKMYADTSPNKYPNKYTDIINLNRCPVVTSPTVFPVLMDVWDALPEPASMETEIIKTKDGWFGTFSLLSDYGAFKPSYGFGASFGWGTGGIGRAKFPDVLSRENHLWLGLRFLSTDVHNVISAGTNEPLVTITPITVDIVCNDRWIVSVPFSGKANWHTDDRLCFGTGFEVGYEYKNLTWCSGFAILTGGLFEPGTPPRWTLRLESRIY